MKYFLYFIIFILGACIISFLKVIAHDYPQIDVKRRSHCDYCGRILRWFEIIPIAGYFITNGKCLSCKNQIDFWNPFWEFIGGIIFLSMIHFGDLIYLPLFIGLVILAFTDAYYGYVYPITYLIIVPTLFFTPLHILNALLTYFALLLISRKYPFGLGDIEILAILSLILGLKMALWILMIACLFCIISFLFNQKRSFRFIPYIAIATGFIYMILSFNILTI
ncbi:prepilin peptidase [Companilactobacillus huachuanensis]|uniref:Prepilin peptidase n=1 Tax=Companilactobacillus huachuanensis TaxID=2559914 RepID=A0ABW1RLN7_9LACO|nr:A24 family peptidase [Companilactobacillus huachuanensis]